MKKFIFFGIIILLIIPPLQKELKIFPEIGLYGDFLPVNNINISLNRFFSGVYQEKKEEYLKENIGFKAFLIRVNNQILYSFFNKENTPKGVIGKEGYLHLRSYIENVTGENFVGEDRIRIVTDQIGFLQEYYRRRGILFFTIILPSKASYYSEYIPDKFKTYPHNNYEEYISSFNKSGIDYVDLNRFFLSLKGKETYPIFPKNGLHWTTYAMLLGVDSILNYIEDNSRYQLTDYIKIENLEVGPSKDPVDNDAEKFFNLLFDIPNQEKVANIEIKFDNVKDLIKPKTLVVGDSYYYKVYNNKIPNHLFDWGAFWYYNKKARYYRGDKEYINQVKDLDPIHFLHQQDIIILCASHATLHLFPFGFEEYSAPLIHKDTMAVKNYLLKKNEKQDSVGYNSEFNTLVNEFIYNHDEKALFIRKTINGIKKSPDRFQAVKEKAIKNKLTLDEMSAKEAEWYYFKRNENKAEFFIPEYIRTIKRNPDKMKLLEIKAQSNGHSLDEVIKMEAELSFIKRNEGSKDADILKIIHSIKNDPKWLKSLEVKAEKRGISLERMLEKDAEWMYKKNQSKDKKGQ